MEKARVDQADVLTDVVTVRAPVEPAAAITSSATPCMMVATLPVVSRRSVIVPVVTVPAEVAVNTHEAYSSASATVVTMPVTVKAVTAIVPELDELPISGVVVLKPV